MTLYSTAKLEVVAVTVDFPGGWVVKIWLPMLKLWVRSLGWEDPLEEEMAINSSTLAWRIPWTEEPGGLQSMGFKESDTTERLNSRSHSCQSGNEGG